MEGGGLAGVPIAACEVHTHCEVDLAASHDVLQEGVEVGDLCVCVCVCKRERERVRKRRERERERERESKREREMLVKKA